MNARIGVTAAAVVGAVAAAGWAVWPGDGAPARDGTESASAETAENAGGSVPERGASAAPGKRGVRLGQDLAALPPGEPVPLDAQPFHPSPPETDFRDDTLPAPHRPDAFRQTAADFEAWSRLPENRAADVKWVGVDCRMPPCVMALEFNADRDARFFDRSEAWGSDANTKGAGKLYAYPHLLDRDKRRAWYWTNPYAEGTPEHHQHAERAIQRIRTEILSLPDYNPSRDLMGQP